MNTVPYRLLFPVVDLPVNCLYTLKKTYSRPYINGNFQSLKHMDEVSVKLFLLETLMSVCCRFVSRWICHNFLKRAGELHFQFSYRSICFTLKKKTSQNVLLETNCLSNFCTCLFLDARASLN